MLGSVQLGARLEVQLEAQLGIDRGSGLGIQLGLTRDLARLTWLGLVPGISSTWKPGPARSSGLGSGLGARLGLEPSSAHTGSENIINEVHERRKCKTKRPEERFPDHVSVSPRETGLVSRGTSVGDLMPFVTRLRRRDAIRRSSAGAKYDTIHDCDTNCSLTKTCNTQE